MALPGLANATTVPDAIYDNAAYVNYNGFEFNEVSHSQNDVEIYDGADPVNGHAQYWAASTNNNYNVPALHAGVQVSSRAYGSVDSRLTYFIEFVGAPGTVAVNVKASGEAGAANLDDYATGPGEPGKNVATAILKIYREPDALAEVLYAIADSNLYYDPGIHSFSLDQAFDFEANTVYAVLMEAAVQAEYGRTASAFIDPYFTAPAGYDILISAGIGNAPAAVFTTPIPATLPLFASGLGGLAYLGRRRRRKLASAA
jgi:hypothetical protein